MTRLFDPIHDSVVTLPALSLVNASAGTGKTWTVTHLAARWLVEADDRHPKEILLVTFAREAAGELKSRLREHLEEFAREIAISNTGEPSVGELQAWQVQLREVLRRDGPHTVDRRCARVLRSLDEVNARTIHSFASIIQGGSDHFADRSRELRERAAREALIWATREIPDQLGCLLALTKSGGSRVNRVREQLSKSLQVVLPMGGISEYGLAEFIEISPTSTEGQQAIAAFRTLLIRAQMHEQRLREFDRATTFDAVIGDLVIEIRSDVESVRRRVGSQFKFVIIDEFQDTDAGQWEIFSQLFLEGPHPVPMLVVGDAKQAIYSFRGGDVSVMQRLQTQISLNENMAESTLTRNFRSHSGLLQQINQFYQPVIAEENSENSSEKIPHVFIPGNEFLESIEYVEVDSPASLATGHGLFTLRDIRGVKKNQGGVSAVRAAVHHDVLAEIERLTSDRGTDPRERPFEEAKTAWSYSDIVILARRKESLRAIQREMDRLHIPYVTPRSLSVFGSVAASEIRWLLWALSNAHDQRRWRSLSASWFAFLVADLASPIELATLTARQGLSALHRTATGGSFLSQLLQFAGGQRHITDVDHVFSVLATQFPHGAAPAEVLAWLEAAIVEADGSDDSVDGQRRIESDENAIRLMTIHAAKGLQFPVVLLPDLETMGGDPYVVSKNSGGKKYLDLNSVLEEKKERDIRMRTSIEEENDRLIYVGLTRGEQVVTAWVSDDLTAEKMPAWHVLTQPWIDQEHRDGPAVIKVTQDGVDTKLAPSERKSEHLRNVTVLPITRSSYEPSRRWSYSSLHHAGTTELLSDFDGRSAAEDDGDGRGDDKKNRRGFYTFGKLRGASLGDAVHGIFEIVVGEIEAADIDLLDTVIARQFAAQGLVPPEGIRLTMQRLLTHSLGTPWENTSLNDYAHASRSVSSEMRFTIPVEPVSPSGSSDVLADIAELVVRHDAAGPFTHHFQESVRTVVPGRLAQGFLTGSIDLVAPTLGARPRYVILDYKSNSLTLTSDFSATSLAVEMASSGYPLQALIYSVALHRHLSSRLPGYQPDTDLGGATYFYLRGAGLPDAAPGDGVFHWDIPPALTVAVSAVLRGEKS